MNTRLIKAASGVIHRAMQQGKELPVTLAIALDAACLLQSPETAAETAALRDKVAELQARIDELVAQRDDLLAETVAPSPALAVPCPPCDAGIDGPCRNVTSGQPMDTNVHQARTDLYELCETEAGHPATDGGERRG